MNKFKENLKKIWAGIIASKLNISMFAAGVIAFILLVVILGIIIHRDGQVNNELIITGETKGLETTLPLNTQASTEDQKEETTKTEEQFSTKIDENETTNIVSKASSLSAKVTVKNSWTNDGEYFIQYNLEVTNISDKDINSWALVLDMAKSYTLVDSWNYTFKAGNKKLIINPLNENRKIPSGETVTGGFIIKGTSNVYVDYITIYTGSKIETIKNGNTYVPPATKERKTENVNTTTPEVDTTTGKKENVISSENITSSESTTESKEENTTIKNETTTPVKEEDSSSQIETGQKEIITPDNTTTAEIITSTKNEIVTPENETVVPITQ